MTTYTVKYHTPDLPRIRGKLEETNIEADSFRTARDGNSVTFFGRVNSDRMSNRLGSPSEQKVGFFNRVCSIVIHRPDEEVKLHDHSLDEPASSSEKGDQDDEDDESDF